MSQNPYRMGSWSHEIYRLLDVHDGNVDAVINFNLGRVSDPPLIFKRHNPVKGGPKISVPYHEQCEHFRGHVRRLARQHAGEFTDQPTPEPQNDPRPEPTPPEPKPQPQTDTEPEQFLRWIQSVVSWQQRQDDQRVWGYRQAINGRKLMLAGMPVEAIKDAFTIDWDAEARRYHNVREYDLTAWGASRAQDGESPIEAVLRVTMKAGVNACMVGGAGIGKTTALEHMGERDGVHTVIVSCNPEAASPEFYGVQTPMNPEGPFVLSDFTKALLKAEQGERVRILLDEMDAMDAQIALMLNRALEQRKLSHRFLGRTIEFGGNVEFFGAMNTTGHGGDGEYDRERLDAAFMDRFFRFRVKRCDKLEREIFYSVSI